MEKLDDIDVVWFRSEMFLEQPVNGSLEHESIIDRDQSDFFVTVPTRLTTTSYARIHDVVRNEEEGLELWSVIGASRIMFNQYGV